MFQSVYTQLWGEPATEAYLKAAAKAGLNVTEFAWRERHKPEFVQSESFRNKASSLADMLHSMGVV
jgi:hydroxypyruvate isomerase